MTTDIIIQDREELIYLLCEAAEFEHAVMCTYLYAMWSLKEPDEGEFSAAEQQAIIRWRTALRQIAREEMLHLCLVNNLLASLGASPHLWKPEFPVRPGRFPASVIMKLMPFSLSALDHFLYIERPEGLDIADGKGFEHTNHYHRVARPDLLTPAAQDYVSQGHLYHGVLQGLIQLSNRWGEPNVFVGHDQAQVAAAEFGLPGLFKVTDLASAKRAIEEIVIQGEGAPAHSETSHYARFASIKREFAELKANRETFVPARQVAENPTLGGVVSEQGLTAITNKDAAKLVDMGNAIYALMMRVLAQVFSPAPLPAELRVGLAVASTELMYALQITGEAATKLPVAPGSKTAAGLTFSMPRSSGQLVQRCAGQILSERALELGQAAQTLSVHCKPVELSKRLLELARRFDDLHERYEEHIAIHVDRLAVAAAPPKFASETESDQDINVAKTEKILISFDARRCIHSRHCVLEAPNVFRANTPGKWIHPEAASVEHATRVAQNCPSGAITYERFDGGPGEQAPSVNVIRVRENGPYAINAEIVLAGVQQFRATLCRCGQSQNKPYCDNSHIKARFTASGEPAAIESDPLELRGGALTIEPLPDGPLQVLGNAEICSGTGRTISRGQNARLCRCGGSQSKPFCDGSHTRNGFKS